MNLVLLIVEIFCVYQQPSLALPQLNLSDTNEETILSLKHLSSILDGASDVPPPHVTNLVRSLLDQFDQLNNQAKGFAREDPLKIEKEANYSKGRVWSVIGAALLILALSVFGVYLPDIIKWLMGTTSSQFSTTRRMVESFCNSFAAGGFWGLALIHVLKEAIDHLDRLRWGMNVGEAYCNGAYLLICTGYLVMLAVEAFANTTSCKQRQKRGILANDAYNKEDRKRAAILDASVASLALTFHAIFEGMVIGMRPTGVLVWVATTSVAGHKWAESFALSQRMSSNDLSKSWRTLFLSTFLLATPLGAILGLPLGAFQDSPIGGIMSSLSCGVLVYVAGECTSDIFHSHHGHDSGDVSPSVLLTATTASATDLEEESRASLEVSESPKAPPYDLEASYKILLGRLGLMICGMTLLAGMMFVELKTNTAIA